MLSKGPCSLFPTSRNDESSKRVLVDLFHQQVGLQNTHPFDVGGSPPTSSSERRDPPVLISRPTSSEHSYNSHQSGFSPSFVEGPEDSSPGRSLQNRFVNVGMNDHLSNLESGGRLFFRSHSGALFEEQFSLGTNETAEALYGHSSMVNKSSADTESSRWKDGNQGMKYGYKSKVSANNPLLEVQGRMAEQSGMDVIDNVELTASATVKHDSLGNIDNVGFFNYIKGVDNAFGEDMINERVPSILSKGLDNSLLKLLPSSQGMISSSQESLSELASAVKGKSALSIATFDEGRQDSEGNPATKVSENFVPVKDTGFRQNSSCSDACVSETSFVDTLKSSSKNSVMSDASIGAFESLDTPQGGQNGKKKGKKGRQIDPALLGFKVSSNRIMMGEIQHLEE